MENKSKMELMALLFATCYSVSEAKKCRFNISREWPNTIFIQFNLDYDNIIEVNLAHADLPAHIAETNAKIQSLYHG